MKNRLTQLSMVSLVILLAASLLVGCAQQPLAAAPAPTGTTSVASPSLVASPQPGVSGSARVPLYDESMLTSIYDAVSPSVVYITNNLVLNRASSEQLVPTGAGSGFLIDARGYVVTNNHVIEDADSLDVTFADGTTLSGKVLGADPDSDLAVIKVELPDGLLNSGKIAVASLGDSDSLRPGQLAVAIGNPFGLQRTITLGIISGLGRELDTGDPDRRPIRGCIQTDAAINPGNSGGPLMNSAGQVIGINTAMRSPVQGSVSIGFAVPVNTLKKNLETLVAGGQVQHPRIGIVGYPVTQRLADQLGLKLTKGVYVVQVIADSPAQQAGLRGAVAANASVSGMPPAGGDIITAIDGREVAMIGHVAEYIEMQKSVGEQVTLTVNRDGEELQIAVTLDAWPQ